MLDLKARVELTELELGVLRWLARGKSIEDICHILKLTPKAVKYHLAKARDRYGYATTMQTVVRAAQDYGFRPDGREISEIEDDHNRYLRSISPSSNTEPELVDRRAHGTRRER
jgi:DNA-binding CsgD family transcriptional regulator